MEKYRDMTNRHQAEVNALPIYFAFSEKQFKDMLLRMGVRNPKTELYRSAGGGFYRKADAKLVRSTFARVAKELRDALTTSYEFAVDAFRFELANHEFCITYDPEDTIDALGLTMEDFGMYPMLVDALAEAKRQYLKSCEEE